MSGDKFPSGAITAGAIVGAIAGTLTGGIGGAILGVVGGAFVGLLLGILIVSAADVLPEVRSDFRLLWEELIGPALVFVAIIGLIALGVSLWGVGKP